MVIIWLVACLPTFEDRRGRIEEPRILAVRGDPAEARPGDAMQLEALVVGPDGPSASSITWAYCSEPRSIEERTGVTASCGAGDDLVPIGAATAIPSDACARFGPTPPPVEGDEPPRRPSDPDPTGGYFLPVRASTADAEAFGFLRIRCDLAGATRAIFDAFEDRYLDNRHPTLEVDAPETLAPGASERIEVRADPADAEPYVVYVAEESALFDEVETLTASLYVTGGALSLTRVELDEAQASVRFTAPGEPGVVHGWVVLVDSRGGMTWDGFAVEIDDDGGR